VEADVVQLFLSSTKGENVAPSDVFQLSDDALLHDRRLNLSCDGT